MNKNQQLKTVFLCTLVSFLPLLELSSAESTNIEIASVTVFQFSGIIIYSENVQDLLENPMNDEQMFSTFLTIEINDQILATIIFEMSLESKTIVYTLNDPQTQSPMWMEGEEGIHIKQLDSQSIQINLLEFIMNFPDANPTFKAYAMLSDEGIELHKQEIGTILSEYYSEFVTSTSFEEQETAPSPTNTTTTEVPSNSTNDNDTINFPFGISGYPFLSFAAICIMIALIGVTISWKKVEKTRKH